MKTYFTIITLNILTLISCSTWKSSLKPQGDNNAAVSNAICDFLHTSPLHKTDSVFSITITNISSSVLGISILGRENKLLPSSKNKIGSNFDNFPTRFIEKDEKLFIWYDSTHSINKDLILILSKYKQIDSLNVNGFVGIPKTSSIINDAKKGEDYFFCKDNLLKYKKVRTTIAIGYYDPPKLKCN